MPLTIASPFGMPFKVLYTPSFKLRYLSAVRISFKYFEKAAELRDREKSIKEEIESAKGAWKEEKTSSHNLCVTEEDIAGVISSWTNIPVIKIAEEESEKLIPIEERIKEIKES